MVFTEEKSEIGGTAHRKESDTRERRKSGVRKRTETERERVRTDKSERERNRRSRKQKEEEQVRERQRQRTLCANGSAKQEGGVTYSLTWSWSPDSEREQPAAQDAQREHQSAGHQRRRRERRIAPEEDKRTGKGAKPFGVWSRRWGPELAVPGGLVEFPEGTARTY